MSMLAERRRKQKWALDPRNTAWSNDDSKFGQRMLEKMGWSKGKGLGAQEQGATEHIKVQVKNNHLGLGATINNEDNWIAHQDDFNQLLAQLNTCHGQETADSSDNKEKKSFSLEEKSKTSKNRVHYMKFTKGKDLSSRSKMDLDCIFGKRQSKKTLEDDSSPNTPDGDATSTTTSAFTIQEYFAKRMAELKNKAQGTAPEADLSETQVKRKGKKRSKETTDENVEDHPQPKVKKRKKKSEEDGYHKPAAKKKSARDACGVEAPDAAAEAAESLVEPADDEDSPSKPQKRKGKKKLLEPVEVAVDTALDEAPVKKKKKKKKKGSR
ncbi:PIN2/TERF1-interacting telomerase inhibitor 1 [Ochotona curzoniae]|uniref:PIN2/TERF1-interacting telomerase inhibitor 1 n=1 Tax=Ochotona curzoniae TaxID=130825 RepID=UPI001B34D818|nr:PIN2/TERF1-interacting telomerase inhibitor 1 [Ochotona curzoniae]